jgi:2-polyprenyl-6-methoxyphenol hydroxylase-like FAD-dependent oxidoreductase
VKSSSRPGHARAVVLGASMAGLLAARALSETFDEVVVVERDDLRGTGPRKGVPQGQHAHGILAKGREVIEEFFPGLTADLSAAGAVPIDIHDHVVWYSGQNPLSGARSDLLGLSVSRPALEDYVRGRVRGLPNVYVRGGYTVTGLLTDAAREVVTGVRLVGDVEEELSADLVVDATGRGNRAKTWLAGLGYAPPAEETIQVDIAYSTRQYVRSGALPSGKAAIVTAMTPANPYGAVLLPMEGDRWILTLFGIGADDPPTDPDGYDAFAHRLLIGDLHEVVDRAEPLTEPRPFRIPASVRRRYEGLRRVPAGYLVTGDAMCAFNPVYGQGMTVAAAEAEVLRDVVRESLEDVPRRFYAKAARVIDIPWDLAAGGDLAIPTTVGKRTLKIRILNRYVARVMRAAETDTVVSRVFLDVVNLASRPERLFSPAVLRRVLFGRPAVTETAPSVPQPVG